MLANTLDFRRQRPLSTYPKEGLYALDIESGCLEAEGPAEGGVEAFGLHTGQQLSLLCLSLSAGTRSTGSG